MRMRSLVKAGALLLAVSTSLAACGGDDGGVKEEAAAPKTLTYWASNQGPSLEADAEVLKPELARFEKETGIKVNVEVVPWSDLLNRILAATTSGKGPDVVNIGNTWSASLQATGAFVPFDDQLLAKVGGKERFLGPSLAATGAQGQPPTAVPIYGMTYGLIYNKKMFAEAGIEAPPKTWDELIATGKKLTKDGKWGLAVEGASVSENAHHAFIFGQQHGSELFDSSGKPQFDSDKQVAATKQFLDLMAVHKIVNPSNAEYANGTQAVQDFTSGKAGMLLWQSIASSAKAAGMSDEDYGVAPIPLPDPSQGGKQVNGMVAGINLAIFKHSESQDAAADFVTFMTSKQTQQNLNKAYGSLPTVTDAYDDPAFQSEHIKAFQQILATTAAPLPQVPEESQFETLVGTAMNQLFADVASGKPVTEEHIKAKLTEANEKMQAGS
ncbi:sugar ABC transporter substrate-binding protein [Planomonospora venezuelensis]|uniref:Multiple sugar transport system substrate-binding protein n=1 Tax=Planomonospora venezuelensis TaxID=1999 RepID=A0A841D3U0_PLAVE|nr:extracellular solute-binding protein [Planomonospora venezuelensis]MBB5963623.1 multiple sugar transport system substrate-binding protein [Planomonospora venezuelensis]GIN01411.1 sugar ABC transporter substrate-binding protein [Planomonospora venezuelensis]